MSRRKSTVGSSRRIAARADTIPESDEPYWFRGEHPLAGFRSQRDLPSQADIVVIGAGLTGASAAYHLAVGMKRTPLRVVVLDQGDPAGEASGRNGGNFELIPENSVGVYEGLARERRAFLRRVYPDLAPEVLRAESERQASLVLGIALRNRDLLKQIILRERIDCDFSPRGWLHLASTEDEEQGLCEEVLLAAQHGQRIELWSRARIRREIGIDNEYLGRFIPGDGTYHPFKFVCGVIARALAMGAELYSRTRVLEVASERADRHRVVTGEGTIVAGSVIVATSAFTPQLFPELRAIRPHQSQIQVTEGAPDRTRGRVVTSEDGPVFFNQPRGGAAKGRAPLLMGGGADRPMRNPASRRRSPRVHRLLLQLRDRFYPELKGRAASAEWVGPLAFTPDQLPAIGFLRPGVVIAVACNGYGGSYTIAAGLAASQMALTGDVPDSVPEDVFSPRRLTTRTPLFLTRRDSLWRIAESLCRQLQAVDRRISDALTLHQGMSESVSVRPSRAMTAIAESGSARTIPPELFTAFPTFEDFTVEELQTLLAATKRWELKQGTLLFPEASPGGSCFIIVSGAVNVSIEVNDHHELLAQLTVGTMFGQVSLITGEPRSASCTAAEDCVLVELEQPECERILASGSPLALKLLGVVNEGLISALRGADRRLMKLEQGDGGYDTRRTAL